MLLTAVCSHFNLFSSIEAHLKYKRDMDSISAGALCSSIEDEPSEKSLPGTVQVYAAMDWLLEHNGVHYIYESFEAHTIGFAAYISPAILLLKKTKLSRLFIMKTMTSWLLILACRSIIATLALHAS